MKTILLHKKVKLLFATVLLSFCFSCERPNETIQKQLQEIITSEPASFRESLNSKEVMIIIPRTGCSGCIGIADLFYKEATYDTSKIQFVFTRLSSLKTLRIRMGRDVTNKEFVYLDSEGKFSSGKLDSIYPLIVLLKNGIVTEIEFLSPDKKHLINDIRMQTSITETYKSE